MTNSPSRAVKHALERPRRVAVLPIRWRRAILALAIATGLTTVLGSQIGASSAADGAETLFRSSTVHATKVAHTTRPTELGMRFNVTMPGTITGIRYFSTPASRGAHTGSLWAGRRSRIAKVRLPATSTPRWQTASFSHGVHVTPGRTYVVSYYAPHGRYAVQKHGFKARVANGHIRASKAAGVYRRGKGGGFPNQGAGQSNYLVDVIFVPDPDFHGSGLLPIPLPTLSLPAVPLPIVSSSAPATTTSAAPVSSAPPSTTAGAPSTAPSTSTAVPSIGTSPSSSSPPPSSSSGWPDGSNTGVPAGTTLTPYTGSCTISSAKTITGADMTSCDSVLIRAANVVISRSLLPLVDATAGGSASVTLTDDTVRAGNWSDGAIWGYNITASRVNVTGGQHSFHCAGNCTVTDSPNDLDANRTRACSRSPRCQVTSRMSENCRGHCS